MSFAAENALYFIFLSKWITGPLGDNFYLALPGAAACRLRMQSACPRQALKKMTGPAVISSWNGSPNEWWMVRGSGCTACTLKWLSVIMLPFLLTSNQNNYTVRLFITHKSETPLHPIHHARHAIMGWY